MAHNFWSYEPGWSFDYAVEDMEKTPEPPRIPTFDTTESEQRETTEEEVDAPFPSEVNDGDAKDLPDKGFDDTVQRMYRTCSQETVDQIRDTVFDSLFCDGFVHPQQHFNHELTSGCDEGSNCVARPALLSSFGKRVFTDWQLRFWRENTFIIGTGEPYMSTDFLDFLPEEAHDHINKIDLTFTIRDLDDSWAEVLYAKFIAYEEFGQEHKEGRLRYYEQLTIDLERIWFDKFYTVHCLPLRELTLDFFECYGPDGDWLGTRLAEMLPAFGKGWPA
ncbi:MAG: hypothetical protein LQ338_008281, partial [Usnochroma carphineum]